MFDWTINLGHILTLAGMIIMVFSYHIRLKNDIMKVSVSLEHLRDQQKVLNEAFAQLGNILTQVAVQDTRLNMVEKNVDDLRHGDGFVRTRTKTTG